MGYPFVIYLVQYKVYVDAVVLDCLSRLNDLVIMVDDDTVNKQVSLSTLGIPKLIKIRTYGRHGIPFQTLSEGSCFTAEASGTSWFIYVGAHLFV